MVPQCHHILPSGNQCGSPALRGQTHCYYHVPGREPRPRSRRPRYPSLDAISDIRDPAAVQRMLSAVLQALANDQISLYRAQAMLYALQLAINLYQ